MSAIPHGCPNATLWRPSCKRRGCAFCGIFWARNWRSVLEQNFGAAGVPVVTIAITAPGAERLPWDDHYCYETRGKRRPHRHEGPKGCRVMERQAREWSDVCVWNWQKLRQAARLATKRELARKYGGDGFVPWIIARVWEPQKRGVPHLHLVMPFGSDVEQDAAWTFLAHLRRLAPSYNFGAVQHRRAGAAGAKRGDRGPDLQPIAAADAARYLSSYLTGRNSSRKASIRENIADPKMPRGLIWLTPKLTRVTKVTMRTLRRARHLAAALDGRCEPPIFGTYVEAITTVVVLRKVRPKRAGPLADGFDVDEALRFAAIVDAYEDRYRLRPLFYESDRLRERTLQLGQWAFRETAAPVAVAA